MRSWHNNAFRVLVLAGLVIFAGGCGSGGDNAPVCTATGNIVITSDEAGTIPLTSIDFVGSQGIEWPSQFVYVSYSPAVAVVAGGYPPEIPDPSTSAGVWISGPTDEWANPLEFSIKVVNNMLDLGTYSTVFRFGAADFSGNVLDCLDIPVTYTITPPPPAP